ncbi:efflux RND transporter periplasmic adaptor subunit [uncultured Endozoicomonas sp.]|uniref:efflux RND transporter periplasmic adaptor subunit n=1 Tax=uncultured Endozoicomonas sp. TaxID=432652 RepID=UPI00261409A5|nr:efflux RND transporter periplasmic adaptor subunit [uncultured Endozoicomonas sp.]
MKQPSRSFQQIALVFVATSLFAGCSQEAEIEEELLRPVRSIMISSMESVEVKEFPAVIDAAQKANLSFRVSGKLQSLLVKEGELIEKGESVAQLDPTDFEIRLKDRQASYDVAHSDYERARKLVDKGAIARAEVEALKAKVSTAGSQLESAQKELEYTILTAPFSGRIARRYVDNYEEVSAKQEIVSLQDTSTLLVKMELPESVLVRARADMKNGLFYARFNAIPGQQYPLTLKEVSTQIDESNQTYTVTFDMAAVNDRLILPGMSAVVRAEQNIPISDLVRIPAYAVLEDNNGRFVYVVSDQGNGVGVISRREVSTGELSKEGLVITSGLTMGDRVVTAGMSQMTEGMKVRLQEGAAR